MAAAQPPDVKWLVCAFMDRSGKVWCFDIDGRIDLTVETDFNQPGDDTPESLFTPRAKPKVNATMTGGTIREWKRPAAYQEAIDTVQRMVRDRRPA